MSYRNPARHRHASHGKLLRHLLLLAVIACGAQLAAAQTPGTRDTSFDPIAVPDEGWGQIAAQPDGRILAVGGNFSSTNGQFIVSRLNVDGTLDPTFGSGGRASVDVMLNSPRIAAGQLLVDPTGRIYVIGGNFDQDSEPNRTTYTSRTAIARFLPNGTVDTTFGAGGVIRRTFQTNSDAPPPSNPLSTAVFTDFALQTDGKLLLMGVPALDYAGDPGPNQLLIVRLLDNGRLDTGFANGGVAVTTFEQQLYPLQLDVTNDGGIVVLARDPFPTVVKLTAQGALDPAFGTGGRMRLSLAGYNLYANDLMLQPDGMIVVAGARNLAGVPGPQGNGALQETMVARLTATGALDAGFGTGGFSFPVFTLDANYANHVALEPAGKILVAGTIETLEGTSTVRAPFLIRLTANGAVDAGFTQTIRPTQYDGARDLLVTQDGAYLRGVGVGEPTGVPGESYLRTTIHRYFIDPAPRNGSLSTGQTPSVSGFRIEARNASGIEVDTAQLPHMLGLSGTIFAQSADVNATADIFVVAATSRGLYMRTTSGAFVPWNNQVSTLVPAYEDVQLKGSTHVPIYAGQLPFTGTYYLYVGYMRSDGGPLIYIDEPAALEVSQ